MKQSRAGLLPKVSALPGEHWLEVSAPEAEGSIKRLRQVAVGLNVVWAVASDGSVWFRRGVSIPDRPAGNGWVPMTGDMAQVSVGANDQVWAVGSEDRSIYFRTGIVPEEMTGRTWRKVQVGVRKIRTDRASTSSSTGSSSGINISSSPSSRHHVHQLGTSATVEKPTNSFIHKTPPLAPSVHASVVSGSETATNQLAGSLDNLTMQDNQAADISALLTGGQQDGACSSLPTHYLGANKQLRSVRDSSRSLTQLEASKLSGTDSETDSVFGEDEEMFLTDFMPRLIHETDDMAQQSWNWVAAGACTVDPLLPPAYWFTDVSQSRSSNKMSEPWRNRILEELKTRSNREVEGFSGYEAAVDTKSWVQSGKAKVMLPRGSCYEECVIELEWVNSTGGLESSGTLSILSPDKAKTKTQLNLSELAIAMVTSEPGLPRLSLYESCNGARAATSKGQKPHRQSSKDKPGIFRQELASYPQPLPCEAQLSNAFCLGSALEVTGRPHTKAERFTINIQSYWGNVTDPSKSIALHFNPRFKENCVVRNTKDCGVWGMEEREGELPFETEVEFRLRIECHTDCFVIFVNGEKFTTYSHRLRPENMSFIAIMGDMWHLLQQRCFGDKLEVTYTKLKPVIVGLCGDWALMAELGCTLEGVEEDALEVQHQCFQPVNGVTDTAFVPASDTANSNGSLQAMTDTQSYYIYENQRWNPLTGYSSTGLPTDRPTWSDKSGKIKCSKDKIKLQSMHWQWKFTDYVRRRRWERKCIINTSGPWMELGGTKLHDISLRSEKGETTAWAVAANGDALYRCGITKECPQGESWQHVPCEQALSCISLGKDSKLWAVGKKGSAFWRFGITPSNPTGKAWVVVEPPSPLQQISVDHEVWALDKEGKVYLRREVTSVFPEGTHWLMSTDTPDTGEVRADNSCSRGFMLFCAGSKHVRHISCGPSGLWAVLGSGDDPGALGLRCGITDKASSGISWNFATSTGWLHISARSSWATKEEEKEGI
ncbi:hypothetical protein B566_EDAN008248 [Ephemera danica]|nr:hypothetical protein B566_EDAN008248 [Ephemera danica]